MQACLVDAAKIRDVANHGELVRNRIGRERALAPEGITKIDGAYVGLVLPLIATPRKELARVPDGEADP